MEFKELIKAFKYCKVLSKALGLCLFQRIGINYRENKLNTSIYHTKTILKQDNTVFLNLSYIVLNNWDLSTFLKATAI